MINKMINKIVNLKIPEIIPDWWFSARFYIPEYEDTMKKKCHNYKKL